MMHRMKGRTVYRVNVPTPTGWVKRSTGTSDRSTAKLYEVMLHDLGPRGQRRWDLLKPVADKTMPLSRLFDAWRAKRLDALLAQLDDRDLGLDLPGWKRWLNDRMKGETAERYLLCVKTLQPHIDEEPQPWWRSSLTRAAVSQWLNGLKVSGSTKRKYASALSMFVLYLREQNLLDHNPLELVAVPPAAAPKGDFLERDEVEKLVKGAPTPYGDVFGVIYGTGAEVGAVLAVRRRDVDLTRSIVRLPGTKSHTRDRQAVVAEWARPALRRLCADKLPDAMLLAGLDRWLLTKEHKATLKAVGVRHLKLHAARNHWAVRALRGGWSEEQVANQLGHSSVAMVHKVYGRWRPTSQELIRLEQQAEAEAVRRANAG